MVTPAQLQFMLEWAGARLLALPASHLKPTEPRTLWPDYSLDKFQVLDFRPRASVHAVAPAIDEIPLMDEILALPGVLSNHKERRVLQLRSLVNPFSGRHRVSWPQVAKLIESDEKNSRRMHASGLRGVIKLTPPGIVCRIASLFAPNDH